MRVRFEYNQEDIVDASKRFLARSKAVNAWQRQDLIWFALLVGSAAFAVFYRSPMAAVFVGLSAAILCVVLAKAFYESRLEKRLGKIVRESHGDKNLFVCEVALTADGLFTRGDNTRTVTEWKDVEEIVVTEDTIDIFAKHHGGVIVRNRAFKSDAERQQFIDLARGYFESSRSSRQ
jgi:hypothetical protein